MLPDFGQGADKLIRMIATVAYRPGLVEHRIPQPPSPPGLEQTGPSGFAYGSIPRRFKGRLVAGPFFFSFLCGFFGEPRSRAAIISSKRLYFFKATCAAPSITFGELAAPCCTSTAALSIVSFWKSASGTV